ncbi:uncharacterized protein BX664DRAFT_384418 [Halteromyces radiatus]|uniref:uncharacterized protein n=1 Tax=Halteromyces radiatus TaxID=101107 RepID=UPI00221FA36B|nr:uncharacterized protein BX664DRAFT_384418 [Halteromyces radiatus]KAI8092915.1 hypothetical protein BX664DRAFT_384418 [Halteromyces radiatus]
MEKLDYYHSNPHPFSLTTPTREHIVHLLDQLPSLEEVLQRQSRPPVCLYNYYIVLRDRLQMETLLDFWLDVQQAEILHRRYMKQQTKKQNNNKKSSSSIHKTPQSPMESISAESFTSQSDLLTHMLLIQSRNHSISPTTTKRSTMATSITAHSKQSSASSITSSILSTPYHQPTQADMIDTIERIYFRYIVPHAEKELIQLPAVLRDRIIKSFNQIPPNNTNIMDDPKVFQHAKQYVHILLQSSFTLFIRYRVFMNLTLPQQIIRLAAGLFSLLVGFSLEFSLIFLNISPWSKRLWGLIPVTFGIYCLGSSICGLDPIWVLFFNISETTTFKFNAIKQTKVRSILRRRSINLLSVMVFLITIILMIFCMIPGNRL